MNKEFSTTKVTPEGVQKINRYREVFDVVLEELKILCPEGRELALVKTKLEEASFFAVLNPIPDEQLPNYAKGTGL